MRRLCFQHQYGIYTARGSRLKGESLAKRFTDTDKWADPWFGALSPIQKVAWQYLCDSCDTGGVWKVNLPLLSFHLGETVTVDCLKAMGRRVVWRSDEKIWLPGFLTFQYGNLSGTNKAHRGIMRKVIEVTANLPLDDSSRLLIEGFETLVNGSSEGLPTPQVKEKVKVKKLFLRGGAGEILENLYAGYPRKKGKSAGMKKLKADLGRGALIEDMLQSRDAFIEHHRLVKTAKDFVPYFSTWATSWTDCLDANYGQSEDFSESTTLATLDLGAS